MLELIFLGAIAAFLITRLFQVLGTKNGDERPDVARAMSEYLEETSLEMEPKEEIKPDISFEDPKLEEAVQSIKAIDPDFRVDWFLDGASKAFEMVLVAFASGKTDTLQKLMEPDVYRSFEKEINKRNEKQKTLEITLVKLDEPKITAITLDNSKNAFIAVTFLSEQTNIVKDKNGSILEGSPNQIEELTDNWVFAKDITNTNENIWLLAEIS